MKTWMICGSRDIKVPDGLRWVIEQKLQEKIQPGDKAVIGDARGVDAEAKKYLISTGTSFQEFSPVNKAIKTHYLYRNCEMIALCDEVIAFWDGASRGTKFVIDYARARNKPVEVVKL